MAGFEGDEVARVRRRLARELERGDLILFTGAGFSAGACDALGRELPSSATMIEELWALCFGNEPYDQESSLQDLYDVAVLRCPERLTRYLRERLRVGEGRVAEHHLGFFSAPWRRVYTLNVDDVAEAVARRHALPRRLRVITPWERREGEEDARDVLEVVHLNGKVSDDPHSVTFSTLQYASRLNGAEPIYAGLARDLVAHPFVFVGTRLDEVILWQHLLATEAEHDVRHDERPRSVLISPHVSRARALLLHAFNVDWLPMTAEDFAAEVLGSLWHAATPPHAGAEESP